MGFVESIFRENKAFVNYEMEHFLCFMGCILLISGFLYYGRNKWTSEKQRLYIFVLCVFAAFTQLFKVGVRLYDGSFNISEDLPLHLCNIMVLIMPFIMWTRNKKWWGITFFWIMAGCAQSIFTPTLTESLPHYEAIRYWLVHAVIILGALYGILVYKFDLRIKDVIHSAIGLNLLAAFIFPVNLLFDANYMYLNAKPPGKTFYDLLGPWPDYIVMLEFVVLLFFGIIYLAVKTLRTKSIPGMAGRFPGSSF